MKYVYPIIGEKDHKYFLFTIEQSPFGTVEDELRNGGTFRYIISSFDGRFFIQDSLKNDKDIIASAKTFEEACSFCINSIKTIYSVNSSFEVVDDLKLINIGFFELRDLFSKINKRDIRYSDLESFNAIYPDLIERFDRKIKTLVEDFIELIYNEYRNRKRVSEYKENLLYGIVHKKYTINYVYSLFNDLKELENIVFKNKELVEFLDLYFFKGYEKVNKESYMSEIEIIFYEDNF